MIRRATLLYDRDCGVCRWVTAVVLKRDANRALSAVAIQSSEGQRLLGPVPEARRLDSWHLVLSDGQVYSAGDVFPPLLALLRRPAGAWVLGRVPAVTRRGYRLVAGRRSLLGTLVPAGAKRRADEIIARHAPALPEAPPPSAETRPPAAPAPSAPTATPGPPEPAPAAGAPVPAAGAPAPASGHSAPEPSPAPAPATTPAAAAAAAATPAAAAAADAGPAEPDPPPDREPVGWQQRIEESQYGRGVLSTLFVVSLIAIVAINLPGSDLRRRLLRPAQPYLNALGIDQNWSLFAPNPRRVVIDVSATVAYEDGSTARWTFPHDGALVGTYRDYRWRKWAENLISPLNSNLWRPAALWIAAHEMRARHAVTRVTLVERYANLEPPGASPSTGPTATRVFFVLRFTPSGATA